MNSYRGIPCGDYEVGESKINSLEYINGGFCGMVHVGGLAVGTRGREMKLCSS